MASGTIAEAALLGAIEGLTEFLPVSSTAHILLAGHFLGFESAGKAFEVLIQLGAILAVLSVYFARLWNVVIHLGDDPKARRFVFSVLLAFLPAAIVGVMAHGYIKSVLFEAPALICVVLIVGGVILALVDRLERPVLYDDAMAFPPRVAVIIGLFQVLALVPGTSRSGSTIAGALLLGTTKRAAAEFTFFLAIPTMAGAFTYDLYKNRDVLSADDLWLVAVGFVCAFLAGLFVVKSLLDFVSRHGFTPFAWWRIIVGSLGLIGLWLVG